MTEPAFKVDDRVRLTRKPAKAGTVQAVTGNGKALVVVRDRWQDKGDYMRYPVGWWEKVE